VADVELDDGAARDVGSGSGVLADDNAGSAGGERRSGKAFVEWGEDESGAGGRKGRILKLLAAEVGHDVSGVAGVGSEKNADAGAIGAEGGGRGILRDNGAGLDAGLRQEGDDAEVEAGVADSESGVALIEADDVGDGDAGRAEAFGEADDPVAANRGSGNRGLRDDVAGGNFGAGVAIGDGGVEAGGRDAVHGFGNGEAAGVGDLDFGAVNGDAHGDERGDERDGEQRERSEKQAEDLEEALTLSIGGAHGGAGFSLLACVAQRRLSVAGSGWMKRRSTSGAASLKRPSSAVMTSWT
jgi:hypothetical protein